MSLSEKPSGNKNLIVVLLSVIAIVISVYSLVSHDSEKEKIQSLDTKLNQTNTIVSSLVNATIRQNNIDLNIQDWANSVNTNIQILNNRTLHK